MSSFPIQSKIWLSIFSITLTTIRADTTGKINGRAKNRPYNFLSTCSSESLFDRIAGAKFNSIMSTTDKTRHLRMIYTQGQRHSKASLDSNNDVLIS